MKSLEEKMQEVIDFIDIFFHRKNGNWIAVDYIPEEDINKIAKDCVISLIGNDICCESRCYKSRIFDYQINFICKKSYKNDIVLNKDKLFNEKKVNVIFMIKDFNVFKNLYEEMFYPWFKQYKKKREAIKFTMLDAPEINDPNYREYMNEYIKNKLEGKI